MSGYIKLHRKIRDNQLFKKRPLARLLFEDICLDAAWKDTVQDWMGTSVNIARGQIMISQREMSERYGLSRQIVRTMLKSLVSHNMIKINPLPNQGPMIVSICNYSEYQGDQPTSNPCANPPPTHLQPTKEENLRNTTTSSAHENEIEGLNGSTEMYVGWLADWLSPFAPDRDAARQILVSNISIYGSPKVQAGMVELKTQIASGDKPKNIVKAFSAFVKNASTDAKPRTLPKLDREAQINDGYLANVMKQPIPAKLLPVLD